MRVTNRAFFLTIADYYRELDRRPRKLPSKVEELLRDSSGKYLFHHLVYLYGTTCRHPVGSTLSFAHELQHVHQYLRQRELMNESKQQERERKSTKKPFINVPHEQDAMFASKRIAEEIWGRSKVADYIKDQYEAAQREQIIWDFQMTARDKFKLVEEMVLARQRHEELLNANPRL